MTRVTEANLEKIVNKEIEQLTEDNREETVARLKKYLARFSFNITSKNFLFVYGSLRKDQYNYKKLKALFGEKGIEYLYTTKTSYCSLYDLGNYPVLIESRGSWEVTGDVIYCNKEVFNAIKQMEEEAGYIDSSVHLWLRNLEGPKDWKVVSVISYVAGEQLQRQVETQPSKYPRIFKGDWCKHLRSVEVEDTRTAEEKLMSQYGYECY